MRQSEVTPSDAQAVRERLALAGELLSGLALVGSPARSALERVRRGPGWTGTGVPDPAADLVAAINALQGQARMVAEAGRRAGDVAPWVSATAPHWHEYLGWLRDELASLEARADRLGDWSRRQVDAALRAACDEFLAARLQWAPIG